LVKITGVSLPEIVSILVYYFSMNELPPHRSYSQLSTWQSCPQKYYLSKVAMVPEKPAVYLAAGSAVHSMLEWLNHELYKKQLDN
jgi:ATP-dependent helicase/DNAse subunit B